MYVYNSDAGSWLFRDPCAGHTDNQWCSWPASSQLCGLRRCRAAGVWHLVGSRTTRSAVAKGRVQAREHPRQQLDFYLKIMHACRSLMLFPSCFGWEARAKLCTNAATLSSVPGRLLRHSDSGTCEAAQVCFSYFNAFSIFQLSFGGLTITQLCKNGCPGAAMPLHGT